MTAQKGNPCNRASFEESQQAPQSFPLVTNLIWDINTLRPTHHQREVSPFVGLGIFAQREDSAFLKVTLHSNMTEIKFKFKYRYLRGPEFHWQKSNFSSRYFLRAARWLPVLV